MERLYRVGELAEAAGLTVRTLHHYEEVGLLSPQERSHNGYRLYGEAQVMRLYQILALRQLGLSLDQIREVLARQVDPLEVVKRHLEAVERTVDLQGRLRDRLRAVLAGLDRSEEPTAEGLLEALEVMNRMEQYYTPEQLSQLAKRRDQLGDEGMARAQQEWADLIAEARSLKEAEANPRDPRAQAVAHRWNELIESFTGGDAGMAASLQKLYETEGPEKASRGMLDAELVAWVSQAQRHL